MLGPLSGVRRSERATAIPARVRPLRLWILLGVLAFVVTAASSAEDFLISRSGREQTKSEFLLLQAQTLADSVDLDVARDLAVLHGLAVSTVLATGDLNQLASEMNRAGAEDEASIVLVDRDGLVVRDALSAAPSATPRHIRAPELMDAITAGQAGLTNLFRSARDGSNRLAVVYPLTGDGPGGSRLGALIYVISPHRLVGSLTTRTLPPGTVVSFVDRNGTVAASTGVPDAAGQPEPRTLESAFSSEDHGTASLGNDRGERELLTWARAPRSKFVVAVTSPPPVLPTLGRAFRPVIIFLLLGFVGVPAALLLNRRFDARAAGTQGAGADPSLGESASAEQAEGGLPAEPRTAGREHALHAHRLEIMGTLASGVAHDFGNVLQVLDGSLRIIRDNPLDTKTVEHSTDIMLDVLGGARSVVRRLLSFARDEVLDTTECNVMDTLGGIAEILRHTFPRQIKIVLDVPVDLPPMLVDKARLEAALLNVATNAQHAMPDGGTLSISARLEQAPQVGLGAADVLSGDFIRIDATDTGTGMSAEILARATEAFYTTKPAGQGTGLGLSATRSFAEESGGALQLRSQTGLGTTVSLWLPRAAAMGMGAANPVPDLPVSQPAPPPEPAPEPEPNKAGAPPVASDVEPARVILVDDEPMIRNVLARQLIRRGMEVLACADAAEALAALESPRAFDLLLTDFAMPDMPGDVLVARAWAVRPGLPVIVLTGHPHDAEVLGERARDSRIRLLSKPISGRELADEIDLILGRALKP